jgi:hypothetical protein
MNKMNDMLKEIGVAYIKVLSRHLSGGTEKNWVWKAKFRAEIRSWNLPNTNQSRTAMFVTEQLL